MRRQKQRKSKKLVKVTQLLRNLVKVKIQMQAA